MRSKVRRCGINIWLDEYSTQDAVSRAPDDTRWLMIIEQALMSSWWFGGACPFKFLGKEITPHFKLTQFLEPVDSTKLG
uniref:Uncharacterized protein n=1 Tax=Pristionchus pacificus TaxID=54126 RepID=A0A2A6BRE5_PRIPA|eukprot:PDM68475.1 hypothetical protein PRIPAC_43977 [Pristionchus pacificus]